MSLLRMNAEKAGRSLARIAPNHVFKDFATAVFEQAKEIQAEAATLAALPVPAAFTSEKPDTDLARAARAQNLMMKKGLDPMTAWERATDKTR